YRVGLPGDSVIPTYELHAFDVDARTRARVDLGTLEAVNTSCCQVTADTLLKDVRWGRGSGEFFFTRGTRSFDTLQLHVADASTGASRLVVEETGHTYVESNGARSGLPNWRVVGDNREVVWWSERDGWGHLYLYDVATGSLKNRITEGAWLVVDVLHVDPERRLVYFTAVGREGGRDRYFRHLYRASLDGGAVELLSPEDADHEVAVSPSGRYFLDTYSTRGTPQVTVVRNSAGGEVMEVERADYSRLLALGWNFPTHFTVKARDGVTELHGYLYFPSDFDPDARYPVVDYIYPGPQVGPIGWRQATVSPGGNGHALAELGFIVFTIDAMGTPARDKAFHDAFYGDMRDNGIPDHIEALRQLAVRYPQMDLERVGIFGHSGGGFSSTDAILTHPEFFKVAVSSAGNHDNRSYDYSWGEKYQGLLTRNPDGTDSFDAQANQNLAERLEGKLLLMYGTLDDNVHPNATLLLIDELVSANKDFDLIVMPNRNHGYANEPYVVRRTWDYFVSHLLGVEPPRMFDLKRPSN
ncbi:MAG: prolyl oligopeptidase family serine peptidase, partial [Gemmatimonadota bacterium]|nr:prolyl oligopeptidase family serine peptidase [Gemmatimonadota bacterium]